MSKQKPNDGEERREGEAASSRQKSEYKQRQADIVFGMIVSRVREQ